jgi:two-component system sensor histidine kinase YesM
MSLHNIKNIKSKIVFFSTLCIAFIGIISNLYLYTYMNNIIFEKAHDIDVLYLDGIQKHLDSQFAEILNLGILCASSYEVSTAMRHSSLESSVAKKEVFTAQTLLNDYLHSSIISPYVNKLFVFNEKNLTIQASAKHYSTMDDLPHLLSSDFYKNYQPGALPFCTVMPSVTEYKGDCLVALFPISNYISPSGNGYLYMEVDLSLITDVLEPYTTLNPIFIVPSCGPPILPDAFTSLNLDGIDLRSIQTGDTFSVDEKTYRADIRPLSKIGLSICNCSDLSAISIGNRRKTYAVAVVITSVLLTSLGITIIISNYITKPIQKLIARIKRISESDFSIDPKSEASNDEIGEVFKVVNEMSLSIDRLIKENAEQNEQKKNIEIDLLQSQVNPHFLYNTLDSIHWMAVIQKNPGISNITRCLSNLLKNMSKGFSQKITLEEELSLLDDYITIQSIRYMETFELINHIDKAFYHYRIVKLTLQPLVENAIFHGIEPSGVYGTITLDAKEEGEYLIITVTDTGVGMTSDELSHMLDISSAKTRHSMNGIGVGNVNKRLQLIYGLPCGLSIQSEKGAGTCISVRIKKEETDL